MSSWNDMRKAKEGDYFNKKDQEKLKKLAEQANEEEGPISPVTGEPMQKNEFDGVPVFCCKESGGIWIDQDSLEKFKDKEAQEDYNFLKTLFEGIAGCKE